MDGRKARGRRLIFKQTNKTTKDNKEKKNLRPLYCLEYFSAGPGHDHRRGEEREREEREKKKVKISTATTKKKKRSLTRLSSKEEPRKKKRRGKIVVGSNETNFVFVRTTDRQLDSFFFFVSVTHATHIYTLTFFQNKNRKKKERGPGAERGLSFFFFLDATKAQVGSDAGTTPSVT